MSDEPKQWWQTLPAIIAGSAALVTAITGLLIALGQLGLFKQTEKKPTPPPEVTEEPVAAVAAAKTLKNAERTKPSPVAPSPTATVAEERSRNSPYAEAELGKLTKEEEKLVHDPIDYQRGEWTTDAGQAFVVAKFFERNLGDRKAELDALADQLGAEKRYVLIQKQKRGNVWWERFFLYERSRNSPEAKSYEESAETNAQDGKRFLAENRKKEGVRTTASGLQYKVIKQGTGAQPKGTDSVTVQYRGTLINGTEFDSSYKRGQPAKFPLNGVIKGWTEGVQLMKVGSKYQFFIPPNLAYGDRNVGHGIGANSTLIFEVELVGIESRQ